MSKHTQSKHPSFVSKAIRTKLPSTSRREVLPLVTAYPPAVQPYLTTSLDSINQNDFDKNELTLPQFYMTQQSRQHGDPLIDD
jgi:hypothetical protein